MANLSYAEKEERVQGLRPIDDVFFEVLARRKKVMQELLRTIFKDDRLIVKHVTVQCSERNLYGRSVRLDAVCVLRDGTICNVEVQRADNDDHYRRVRFNEAILTVRESQSNSKFRDIPNVYMVYISEKDFIGGGSPIYHINKVIQETGTIIPDGIKEIYVNCGVTDSSDVSELMTCFKQKMVSNPKFPELSKAVHQLKTTERGLGAVCKVMKKYEDAAKEEGRKEGFKEGEDHKVFKLVQKGWLSVTKGAEDFNVSVDEFLKRMKAAGFKLPTTN